MNGTKQILEQNKIKTSITVRPKTQENVEVIRKHMLLAQNVEVSFAEIYDVCTNRGCQEAIEAIEKGQSSRLIQELVKIKEKPKRLNIYWNSKDDTLSICDLSSWNPIGHYQTNQKLLIEFPILGTSRGFCGSFDNFKETRGIELEERSNKNRLGRKLRKGVHINIQGIISDITNQPELDPRNDKSLKPTQMDLYSFNKEFCNPSVPQGTEFVYLLVEYINSEWRFTGFINNRSEM